MTVVTVVTACQRLPATLVAGKMPPARATAPHAPKSKTAQSTEDWRANKRRENPNFDKEQAEAAC